MEELRRTDPEVEVVWRAFELRPAPAPALDPRGEYLTRVWRDSVYPLAERLNVRMRLPPPIQPRSRRAHEAAKWAHMRGRFGDYNAGVFSAFFERGEDISEAAVLLKQAGDLGLDESGLRAAFVADRRFILSGVCPRIHFEIIN